MPLDTTPSTVATNALSAIPFSAMIGGPLDAAIKAQALAAKTSWEFIQTVGLQEVGSGDDKHKEAISVSFQYQKDGEMVNLVVPLLAIVPIPYIAIDTITIDFTAKIDASASTVTTEASSSKTDVSGDASISLGWGIFGGTLNMKGGYSSKKSSKATADSKYSVEYTLDIHVEAGQDSMPAGLATVLNILNSAITEGKPGGTFEVSPSNTFLDPANADSVAMITVKARDGQDKAVTTPVTFTLHDVAANTITATAATGTASTDTPSGALISITPDSRGIASVVLSVTPGATVAATVAGSVTVAQGDASTATVGLTVLKGTAPGAPQPAPSSSSASSSSGSSSAAGTTPSSGATGSGGGRGTNTTSG